MWMCRSFGKKALETPVHHCSINPDPRERRLTDEEAWRIVQRMEEKFGYDKGQHQAVMVEHVCGGRQHFHVVFNRVDMKTHRGHWPGSRKYSHKVRAKFAAIEMSKELGLTPVWSRSARRKAANLNLTHRTRTGRSNNHGKYSTKNLIGTYLKLCHHPLSDLRGWMDAQGRTGGNGDNLFARPTTSLAANDGLRPVRGTGGVGAGGGFDCAANGRAQTAADAINARFAAAIEAVERDPSLTPDQRAAAVAALRQRQSQEAGAVRQKIIEEEKQNAKSRRRNYAALNSKPTLT